MSTRNIFSGNGRRLLENLLSLSSVHLVYNILSLITVPYLTRVLGPANFGLVGFIMALMTVFTVLTDYGFNLSATNRIACHRENPQAVSGIFSAVLSVKLLLGAIGFALWCGLVLVSDKFSDHRSLYFILYLGVVGNILFPAWLFQGFESMRLSSSIHISIKFLSTAAIFVAVRSAADTSTLIWIYSLTNLASGVLGLAVARNSLHVRYAVPAPAALKAQAIEGGRVFLSSVGTLIYTSSTVFFLGLFSSHEVVGYFSGADKIRVAIQGLFTPLFQTVHPHVGTLAQQSRHQAWTFVKIEAGAVSLAGVVICGVLFVFADGIVLSVLGDAYLPAAALLKIMAIIPTLVLLGNVLSVQYLLALGLHREYLRVFTVSSTVGLIAVIGLSYAFGGGGTAVAVVIAELTALVFTLAIIGRLKTGEERPPR